MPPPQLMDSPASVPAAFACLRLMGSFSLVIAGVDRGPQLGYEKVRLMLAVLALAQGQPVSRARLAQMLWPDVDVPEGRSRVRHALHTLKQVFKDLPDALEINATQIRLRVDLVQVDVLSLVNDASTPFHIDDAQRLDWYRPPLLDTANAPPTGEFDSWLQGWRARVEIEMAQWRQRVIDQHLKDNALSLALAHATRWTERWPEDESCHRTLIRLLVATGQHDAAMLAFEHCSRILADRLDTTPSAETRALLGLQESVVVSTPTRRRSYGREFRPLAVLAVTLSCPAQQRDAEVAVEALEHERSNVLTVMQHTDAWVTQLNGGFLLAYFGYPRLTERPIEQALALARTLCARAWHEGINLGIGLHADVALVEPQAAVPDAAALLSQTAMSLSLQARHRETLLSQPAVQRLSPSQYLALKRAGRTDYVLEHQPHSELAPRLHGRAREFDFLVGLWMRQQPGRLPTVVTLTGYAGIGKSLLASAMGEYAVQSGGQRIVLSCGEFHQHLPLSAALQWLRQQHDMAALRLRDVGRHEVIERVCDMFGLRRLDAEKLEGLLETPQIPEARVPEAQELLITILTRCASDLQQPRLIVLENLQWADRATLTLLEQIASKPTRMPMMILVTSRDVVPEPCERTLRLGPLSDSHMAQFVSHRLRTQKLSRKQRQHVLEHCHGVPLYAVLLIRQTTQDLPLEYSCSLTDTLCVEMHRLPPATLEVAQLGTLIGPRVDQETLAAVLAMSEEVAQDAISELLEKGLLMNAADGGLQTPTLIQLAVKRLTPRKTRQRLHTSIVRHLINSDAAPALIAPHAEAADEPSTPIWWQRSAIDDIRINQPRRARAHLERALKHANRIDTSEARRQFEFECQMLLGDLAAVTVGPGAQQTLSAYEAANRLLPTDDPHVVLVGMWSRWQSRQHTGRYTEALDLARRHMRLAIELDVVHAKGWSHYALGQTYLWCGQLAEAEHELEQAIHVLDAIEAPAPHAVYGDQTLALVPATLALCLALQGQAARAVPASQDAIHRAISGGSPVAIAGCLLIGARVQYLVGSVEAGAFLCQGLLDRTPPEDAHGPWYAMAQAYAALPQILAGTGLDALQQLQAMIPVVQEGMPTVTNSMLCLLARGLIASHLFDEAAAALATAEEINRLQSSYTVEPEIHCLRGDLWLARGDLQHAQQAWQLARLSAVRHGLLVYAGWADSRLAQHVRITSDSGMSPDSAL
jgi:DNA-binding SARP family transcriptional activator/tetratricopeptide (TPR) repeat protein